MKNSQYFLIAAVVVVVVAGGLYFANQSTAAVYTVTVAGTLSADPATIKQAHDQFTAATKDQVVALGDISHNTFLGLQDNSQFFAVDRWTNFDNMQAFYSDPQTQQGFGSLFAGPPALNVWQQQTGWETWGSFDDLKNAKDGYILIVRGRFKDAAAGHALHDQATAGPGKQQAMSLGDSMHLVFLDPQDSKNWMAIDIWSNLEGLQTYFSNPELQNVIGQMFEAPPTQALYTPTDWNRW